MRASTRKWRAVQRTRTPPTADEQEARARWLAERLAIALQAAILLRGRDPRVATAFCASRLAERRGLAFGTLAPGLASRYLLERALPREPS
jgi:putative acyl-CoA dehydrogenase